MKKTFWDRTAKIYDRFMKKDHKAYKQMYSLIYPVVRHKQVLELATGTGLIAKHIARSADHMEATDASSEMIEQAKQGVWSTKLHFSVQDMFHLPYADRSFDVVIVSNALHIVPEPEKALAEIRRVLKDDGVLIAPTFTHGDNGFRGKTKAFFMKLVGFRQYSKWSSESYLDFLRKQGWTVQKCEVLKASFPLTYVECVKGVKMMERKDAIQNAYRLAGSNSFYDGMITCSTVGGKAVCRTVWGMGKVECDEYLTHALSGIPADFSGKLLEVPVGTGILTMPVYQTLPHADITCLDYSPDMMGQAQEKAEHLGLSNVRFRQGDVGALPFADGSFDTVVSLNGFHAFPDKEAAYRETHRVLKPGGVFCGCFYVKGSFSRTDWFILHLYQPMKFFTPPYETVDSLKHQLEEMYDTVEIGNVKGIAWFVCRKGEAL